MEMITKALELLSKFGYARGGKKGGGRSRRKFTRSAIAEVEYTIERNALLETKFSGATGLWD